MNKKLLCAALLGGLSLAQAAQAQDFDDRWYLTGSVGFNVQDNDRGTRDAPFGTIGVGKFISPNWSFDGELNYQKPVWDYNQDLNWGQYGISFDARYHFISEGRNWNPYLVMGLGWQEEEIELDNFPNPDSPLEESEGAVSGKFGVGMQGDMGRVGIRTELAYRAVALDDTRAQLFNDDPFPENNDGEDWFGDILASVGIIVPLGPEPVAAVPPPPAPSCADADDDGDGVNNCDDKCPGSQAGQTIGPDGCPVPVSIDLKGVNFDFDKATLRPDAVDDPRRGGRDLQALSGAEGRSGRSYRPVRQGCLQPGPVRASFARRVRLPDQQRHRRCAPDRSERLRREPSAGRHGPGYAGLQEREEPPHRAERPELSSRTPVASSKPGPVPGFVLRLRRQAGFLNGRLAAKVCVLR